MSEISTMELALISSCPHRCHYCPIPTLDKAYAEQGIKTSTYNQKYMDLNKFKIALDKIPTDTWIDFSATAEPSYHPQMVDFINHTYKTHKTIRLYSTLAGLKAEKIKDIAAQFQVIVLHLPDKDGILKMDINDEYLYVIDQFTDKFSVIAEVYGDLHPKLKQFEHKFKITPRQLNSKDLISRGSLVKNSKFINIDTVKPRQGRVRCKAVIDKQDQSLKHNVMNWEGWVFLCCCSAFNLSHRLGNLFTDSYDSLFESDEYLKMMRAQDDPEFRLANDIMCSRCELSIEI